MPAYQNKSLHDMHGLLQQLDTLNAAHAPEHLDLFEGLIKAGKSAYNAGNDMYMGLVSEEQVILHQFSKKDEFNQTIEMTSLLGSNEIRAENKHLLEIMLTSSKLKPLIMQKWYANGIPDTLRKSVYDEMYPKK